MKTQIKIMIAVLSMAMAFTNCKKDAGPKGDKGEKGEAGINGTDGTNGANGNANVKNYSITIHPSDWSYNSTYSQWQYNYYISENFNSAVIAYVMSGNGKQAIPYYEPVSNCQFDMANNLFASSPYIKFQYINFASTTTAPSNDQYMYLVVIPPAMIKPGVNVKNYAEVKAAYNLKD